MNWTYAGCAFKNNPLGMFAPTNPDVSCKGYDFSLQEKPGFLSLAGALTYESILPDGRLPLAVCAAG